MSPAEGLTFALMRTLVVVAALIAASAVAASAGAARQEAGSACSLSALRLKIGGLVSEKTGGQATLPLVLTSRAATPCVLDGYPSIALFDRHGHLLPFAYRHNGDQMITGALPKLVQMQRGTSAYIGLNKIGCQVYTTRNARMLRIALPGSSETRTLRLQHYPILNYCGRGFFSRVAVSPFERRPGGWACVAQNSCVRRK
ncbi:DUF4232 domain-containing protein [Amnibacterium sp.]|uniref:DUF4232 domain-containing protein n=1 Tax=Amnibacterium sp. TaxID=1872496 RepID=UPI003F7C2CAD